MNRIKSFSGIGIGQNEEHQWERSVFSGIGTGQNEEQQWERSVRFPVQGPRI
jgi:hypothetical protein